MYYANQTISDYLIATAGRTFPTNASRNPAGTLFVPTIVAVTGAPDTYRVTFTPTTTGAWLFDVTDSAGERWTQTFQVEGVAGVAVLPTGAVDATDLGIVVYQSDDYATVDGRQRVWAIDGAPNLSGATVTLTVGRGGATIFTATGTVSGVYPGTQTVSVPLTRAQTALLGSVSYDYALTAALATTGNVVTLAADTVTARRKVGA